MRKERLYSLIDEMEFDTIKSFLTYVNVGLIAFITFLFKTLGLKVSFDLTRYKPLTQILIIFGILLAFVFLELLMIFIFYKVVNL